MHELDEILQHHGIKGMHWGIRRNRNRKGGADGKEESVKIKDKRTKLRKHYDSLKRERQWHKDLRNFHNMSTDDAKKLSKRIQLENNLRELTRNKSIAHPSDKEDYLRREFMSNEELSRKVSRLNAKKDLHKQVSAASAPQVELGKKIANTVGGVALAYAKNKNLGPKDLIDAWNSKESVKKKIPKALWEKGVKAIDSAYKNRKKKV